MCLHWRLTLWPHPRRSRYEPHCRSQTDCTVLQPLVPFHLIGHWDQRCQCRRNSCHHCVRCVQTSAYMPKGMHAPPQQLRQRWKRKKKETKTYQKIATFSVGVVAAADEECGPDRALQAHACIQHRRRARSCARPHPAPRCDWPAARNRVHLVREGGIPRRQLPVEREPRVPYHSKVKRAHRCTRAAGVCMCRLRSDLCILTFCSLALLVRELECKCTVNQFGVNVWAPLRRWTTARQL